MLGPSLPTLKPNCLLLVQISRGPLLANDRSVIRVTHPAGETYENLSSGRRSAFDRIRSGNDT
jgi:hypothetical protein